MPRRIRSRRVRRYVFTLFAPSGNRSLPTWTELPNGFRFLVWQVERCPSTDRLHIQGYLELLRPKDLVWLSNNFCRGHFIEAHGNATQNIAYCTKPESRVQIGGLFGSPSAGMGARTDIAAFRDAILSGKRKRDLITEMPSEMAKFGRFYSTIQENMRPRRENKMEVILALGPTGSGKTLFAFKHWGVSSDFFDLPMCTERIWFDGLDGHTLILMDDFDGRFSKLSLSFLLRLLDRYPRRVEIKGAFVWWMPDIIYITTNIHPDQWYNFHGRESQVWALKRRLTHIIDFGNPDVNGDPTDITATHDWTNYLCFERQHQ